MCSVLSLHKNWPKGALHPRWKYGNICHWMDQVSGSSLKNTHSLLLCFCCCCRFNILTRRLLSIFSVECINHNKNIFWLPWRQREHKKDRVIITWVCTYHIVWDSELKNCNVFPKIPFRFYLNLVAHTCGKWMNGTSYRVIVPHTEITQWCFP